MPDIAVVVGNPKARSRTLTVAQAVVRQLGGLTGEDPDVLLIDLAEHSRSLFDWEDETLRSLTAEVAACRLLIAASPTYKATYTGMLKAFFDRYGNNGLRGVVTVAVMVGAAPVHALAPELHLRPLMVELGATVPARALYVMEPDMERLDTVVGRWAETARPLIGSALASSLAFSERTDRR